MDSTTRFIVGLLLLLAAQILLGGTPATADPGRGSWFGAIHCQRGGRGG